MNSAVPRVLVHQRAGLIEAAGNPSQRYRPPSAAAARAAGCADNLAGLGAVLRQHEDENPVSVEAMRLLRLTGCRPSKPRCLRWRKVKWDRLVLIDSKRGLTHVLLGEAAGGVARRPRRNDVRGGHVSGQ